MKEFLVNHDNKWTLQLLDADTKENSYRVAVPSGAVGFIFNEDNNSNYHFTNNEGCLMSLRDISEGNGRWYLDVLDYKNCDSSVYLWRRSETKSLNDTYAEIEQVRQDAINSPNQKTIDAMREAEGILSQKHSHYFKDVSDIEQVRQETVKVTIDELRHRVYKKDVSHLDSIDVYRVLELFNVQSHAVGHAIKKLLCSGGRGAKDEAQDIQEAIDSLIRYQEMKNEDE